MGSGVRREVPLRRLDHRLWPGLFPHRLAPDTRHGHFSRRTSDCGIWLQSQGQAEAWLVRLQPVSLPAAGYLFGAVLWRGLPPVPDGAEADTPAKPPRFHELARTGAPSL